MLKGKTFVQLSGVERSKIEVLLHQGLCCTRIAELLGRSVSTISREIKRNGTKGYKALRAQALTAKRHRAKRKHTVFDHWMKQFIWEKLSCAMRLSPELICVAGRALRADFVSHEWIYRWIWLVKFSQKAGDKPYQHLYQYLRHASRKRKRGNKRHKRGNIVQRRWIDERPPVAEHRKRAGDLECDIMLGKDRKPGILVALDRRSRKAWIRRLASKNARHVAGLLRSICSCTVVRTVTFDNDQSFAEHYRLHPLGIKTFFTHPYSSQEKGSVENRIGLIRMFFPKQTDFTKVTNKEVKKVESIINNRPMRMFNYRTPNQVYEKNQPLH